MIKYINPELLTIKPKFYVFFWLILIACKFLPSFAWLRIFSLVCTVRSSTQGVNQTSANPRKPTPGVAYRFQLRTLNIRTQQCLIDTDSFRPAGSDRAIRFMLIDTNWHDVLCIVYPRKCQACQSEFYLRLRAKLHSLLPTIFAHLQ